MKEDFAVTIEHCVNWNIGHFYGYGYYYEDFKGYFTGVIHDMKNWLKNREKFYKDLDKKHTNENTKIINASYQSENSRSKAEKANDAFIQAKMVNAMEKKGVPVIKDNQWYESKSGVHVDDTNPIASEVGHEWQHRKNNVDRDRYDAVKKKILKLKDKKKDSEEEEYVMSNPDNILDYVNVIQREEMSANRGGVVNQWLHGGQFVDDAQLKRSYKQEEDSQNAYDAMVGGYRPPNLNWEMDGEARNRMRQQQKQKREWK